jgi:hypothetical protein
MSRVALEVGAFTWGRVQRLYHADTIAHWRRCAAAGFECPQEVFAQLFHEDAGNPDLAAILRVVDWGRVRWELKELAGEALRHVRVDRAFQHAVDEARARPLRFGDAGTWAVPPVIVAGGVIGTNAGFELLVGHTRVGSVLGLLDRGDIPEQHRHLVWVGTAA